MEPASETVGDLLAHRAREALNRIIERDATHITFGKMDREDWREYGEQLFTKRQVTTSNQTYGEWISANGLDRGPAAHQPVRSDAIWLYQNWTVLLSQYNGNCNRPSDIRTECRNLGFEWAGKTEYETKRRAGSRRNQYNATKVAIEMGVVTGTSASQSQDWRKLIAERWPEINLKDQAHEQQVRAACNTLLAERAARKPPESVITAEPDETQAAAPAAAPCATRPLLVPERLSKAQLLEQYNLLRADFYKTVEGEVQKRLPDEAKRQIEAAEKATRSAQNLEGIWRHRSQCAVRALKLFMGNWRVLIGALHPDRADRSPESLAKASDIVTRTKNLIEETDYQQWSN